MDTSRMEITNRHRKIKNLLFHFKIIMYINVYKIIIYINVY